ncbi:siderophore iron transporter [Fonsecaea pedrosoi]|nr:siderophore iron transporter [Fonsecaea pedrosoi]
MDNKDVIVHHEREAGSESSSNDHTKDEHAAAWEKSSTDIAQKGAHEDSLTLREVFTGRVVLSILVYDPSKSPEAHIANCHQFLGLAYSEAIGFLLFASLLVTEYNTHFDSTNGSWVPISVITAATVMFSIWGRWSDILGRRYIFLIANVIGVVASIVAATAESINALIAGCVLAGVANAGNQLSIAAVTELLPNRYKSFGIGVTGALILPTQFAPLIAGSFVDHYAIGWRGCWWVMVGLCGVVFIGLLLVYFPPKGAEMSDSEELHKGVKYELRHFDWVGVILLAGSLVSVLLGLQWGGSHYPWKSARVICTIVIGGLGLVGFGLWESLAIPKIPLISLELMRMVRGFVTPAIAIATSAMSYYAMNIIWPLIISSLFTTSAQTASYYQMASPTVSTIVSLIFPPIAQRIGHYKWQAVFYTICQGAITAAMAATTEHTKVMSTAFLAISVAFLTCGTLCSAAPPVRLSPFPFHDVLFLLKVELISWGSGSAFGLAGAARQFMGSVVSAIYITILNNGLTDNIPKDVSAAALETGLPQTSLVSLLTALGTNDPSAIASVPGITPAILEAVGRATKKAYRDSFKTIFFVSIAFSVICTATACFIKDFNDKNTDNHVELKVNSADKQEEQTSEKT